MAHQVRGTFHTIGQCLFHFPTTYPRHADETSHLASQRPHPNPHQTDLNTCPASSLPTHGQAAAAPPSPTPPTPPSTPPPRAEAHAASASPETRRPRPDTAAPHARKTMCASMAEAAHHHPRIRSTRPPSSPSALLQHFRRPRRDRHRAPFTPNTGPSVVTRTLRSTRTRRRKNPHPHTQRRRLPRNAAQTYPTRQPGHPCRRTATPAPPSGAA